MLDHSERFHRRAPEPFTDNFGPLIVVGALACALAIFAAYVGLEFVWRIAEAVK